ncbi:MAG TPA: septum formation initiator family protein [Conexibacter sp.]|jgi:cell division protein FtsB|nr:septum formation initiator family protein [Conexibacter sp.]
MPPARPAARRTTARPPAATALGAAALRVRWDRVGRVALLVLLVGVAVAYVGPARSLLSTWHDSNAKQAQLQTLEREHDALLRRARELRDPRTVQSEARRLGMVKPGERSYVVRGLSGD